MTEKAKNKENSFIGKGKTIAEYTAEMEIENENGPSNHNL